MDKERCLSLWKGQKAIPFPFLPQRIPFRCASKKDLYDMRYSLRLILDTGHFEMVGGTSIRKIPLEKTQRVNFSFKILRSYLFALIRGNFNFVDLCLRIWYKKDQAGGPLEWLTCQGLQRHLNRIPRRPLLFTFLFLLSRSHRSPLYNSQGSS